MQRKRPPTRPHFINSARLTTATDAIASAMIPTRKNRSFSGMGSADCNFRLPTAALQWNKRLLLSEKGAGNNRQQHCNPRLGMCPVGTCRAFWCSLLRLTGQLKLGFATVHATWFSAVAYSEILEASFPSRLLSGPPQLRQVNCLSCVGGASMRTTLYSASQFWHRKIKVAKSDMGGTIAPV